LRVISSRWREAQSANPHKHTSTFPTSTHINGFCITRVCIGSSSSSAAIVASTRNPNTNSNEHTKPLLCVEVGAHVVRKYGQVEVGWCGPARVSRGARACRVARARVCVLLLPFSPPGLWRATPRRVLCAKHSWFLGGVWCEALGGCQIMDCLLVCLHWRWHWRRRWPSAI
jgi:hypothetical protein